MSHISRMSTKIKDIHPTILKKTIETLQKIGFNIKYDPDKNMERDTWVNIHSDYGIVYIDNIPVGFKKNKDKIEILYDNYNRPELEDNIKKLINMYITISIFEVSKSLGFKVYEENITPEKSSLILFKEV